MPGIISVIETLLTTMFVGQQGQLLHKNKTELALLAFAALCAAIGALFLVLALYQYLESLYAPYIAALISSAVVFAIAIIAVILRALPWSKKTPELKSTHDEFSENIRVLITSLCNELEGPVRENPKTSVALAALAGLLMARRI